MTQELPGRLTRRRALAAFVVSGSFCLGRRASAQSDQSQRAPSSLKQNPKAVDVARAPSWLSLPPTPKIPSPTRSELTPVNGTSIYFAQFGDTGPPLLLLHGGLGNSNYWGHQITELAKRFSVTVMDTRGHGRSPLISRALSYGLFAEDAIGLLDFLHIPEVAVIGWSDGAITGLQLAVTKPDRISKLFAFGANSTLGGLKPNGAKSAVFAAYAARCKLEYEELSPHPEKWPQLMEGLRAMWRREPNFTNEKLANIKAPTMISDGEYDEIIKPEHTRYMATAIPGAQLAIEPNTSHFAMLQNPAQFNKILLDFLTA